MDLDILITNLTIKLESFLNTTADLVFSSDMNGLNSGVVFIRNSEWGNKFLNIMMTEGMTFHIGQNQEQTSLAYLLYREPKDKWECRHQKEFNAFLYHEFYGKDNHSGQWSIGDFALHLPALDNDTRIRTFQEMAKDIVR
jgi:hypothetical protein